jgi:hypothetical protein
MSKFYKFFILLGFVLSLNAYAIPKDPCEPAEACCEQTVDPYAFSYPKDVGLSCPRDFYMHGEFLWMRPSEEGLEFALAQDSEDTPYIFPLEDGKVKGFSSHSQEWDWRPGFRLGLGLYTSHDYWNLEATWTYMKIKDHSDHDNFGTGVLLPLLLPPQPASVLNLTHALASWSGDLNTGDIMLGKPYHVSRCFISNPMFGVRAAWIDQDYHVRYYIDNTKKSVTLKNDYWAVGLRGAYEGDFLIGSGWSFYGKAAVALLFGKFDISQESDVDQLGGVYRYNVEDCFYSVQPNAELGFGVSWSKFYYKNQYKIAVKAGYEFHHWWNQNQLRKFYYTNPVSTDTVSRGDLSFDGFMFGLLVDF